MQPDLSTLFGELSDATHDERERYYDAHSISQDMRSEVESLLSFDTGSTLQDIVQNAVGLVFQEGSLDGESYGPFRLLRLIGRGGMGLVYLAERVDGEVRQRVAVKLLRSSLDSPAARQRFLQERQILACLAHPNIARLIDAGHRADGQPYLVMEYIEGRPIDDYSRDLSVRDRVTLIAIVCEAIAAAHQKLVVHRDLKPANIIVDGAGHPHVLDFGIAKMIDDSDATATIERRLTPEYASPEQIKGAPVTTATDVYSLGAVLYKLLTGEAPARDIEPPSPGRKNAAVDRDLDAIVMKAIRIEPHERYATMDKLGDDLRAWLDRRPVGARQGERWYHARRQIRRYWAPIAAGAIAAVGLIAGLVVARSERDLAQQRFDQVRQLANEFFVVEKDIQTLPGSTAVRERIVKTSIKYLEALSTRAGSDWRLKAEIAAGYRKAAEAQGISRGRNLGRPDDAQKSLNKAAALLTEVSAAAPNDRAVLHDLIELVELQARIEHGARNLKAMDAKLNELLALLARYEPGAKDGPDEWRFLGKIYEEIAVSARDLSRMDLPLKYARRSVELRRKVAERDHSNLAQGNLANGLSAYAGMIRAAGDLKGAVDTFQQALAVMEQMAANDPNDFKVQLNIANAHMSIGRALGDANGPSFGKTDEAIRHLELAMSIGRRLMLLDPNDDQVRFNHSLAAWRLGDALQSKDPRRALEVYDEAIGILRPLRVKRFGRDIPLLASLAQSTFALRALGRDAESRARINEATKLCETYRDKQAVYDMCTDLTTRAEAAVAMANGRALDAARVHRDWLRGVEIDKNLQEAKEDIFSAYVLTLRYRLLRDALLAARLKSEADEAEAKRVTLAKVWRSKLSPPNDADLFLSR